MAVQNGARRHAAVRALWRRHTFYVSGEGPQTDGEPKSEAASRRLRRASGRSLISRRDSGLSSDARGNRSLNRLVEQPAELPAPKDGLRSGSALAARASRQLQA